MVRQADFINEVLTRIKQKKEPERDIDTKNLSIKSEVFLNSLTSCFFPFPCLDINMMRCASWILEEENLFLSVIKFADIEDADSLSDRVINRSLNMVHRSFEDELVVNWINIDEIGRIDSEKEEETRNQIEFWQINSINFFFSHKGVKWESLIESLLDQLNFLAQEEDKT